jgi:hypothetical protein
MPSWAGGLVGTFVLSSILAYWFLRLRCRGIGSPFGPRARYWAWFIVLATALTATGVGVLIILASSVTLAYVGVVVPGGLWLTRLPPQRDLEMRPRLLSGLLTLPFSRLYDRIGDDMEAWCEVRERAASAMPLWIADAAQYYYDQLTGRPGEEHAAGRLRDEKARADLDGWRSSIKQKIAVVELIDQGVTPERLRAALHMYLSTQNIRRYSDEDQARLARRLEAEALNELHLFLAYLYRLGHRDLLIYPVRRPRVTPAAATTQAPGPGPNRAGQGPGSPR